MCITPPKEKKLEKGQDLTLDQLRTIARAFESSEKQAQSIVMGSSMKTETDPVNCVKSHGNKTHRNSRHMSDNKKCYRCDKYGHISTDTTCPAKDKECNKCHKVGHFASVAKVNRKRTETSSVHQHEIK